MDIDSVSKKMVIKFLVVISVLFYFAWVFNRIFLWEYLDEDLQKILVVDGYGTRFSEHAYILWVVLTLLSYSGIFFLRRWARDLLMAVYLFHLVLAPFSGVRIFAPYEGIFSIVMITDGMILGLLYFAWSAELYDKRNDPARQT
ncbi:MAG: hypothetical protein RBT81_06915 [Gammaproteobacteria bacterium]|nr:hypothetical protein [Gammaproteobacteria bacterium]